MSKKFLQVIAISALCLGALESQARAMAPKEKEEKCATVEVKSPNTQRKPWPEGYNFTFYYIECLTNSQKSSSWSCSNCPMTGSESYAKAENVLVGSKLDIGVRHAAASHWNTTYKDGKGVHKGENKFVCNDNDSGKCAQTQ